MTSGLGAIFSDVAASYPGQTEKATALLVYPALFMGIGNLFSMPLALVVGRRPVFLVSLLLLVVTGVWCAVSTSLDSHIAGRDIMSLAAGQSEALVPMMVHEIHFLHERGSRLGWVTSIQCTGTAGLFLAQNYLVADMGWRWWYGLFAIFNGIALFLSFFLVCETGYDRSETASTGIEQSEPSKTGSEIFERQTRIAQITTARGVTLDLERHSPRTWREDLRLSNRKLKWAKIVQFYKQLAQAFCIPSMLWLLLINGTFLGLYVLQVSTFATILISPPYHFAFESLGYVQATQIIDCVIFLPVLGYGTDWVIRFMSRRNKGIYEPEFRLIILGVPAVVGVICAVMYGQAASHPTRYSWATIVVTYNAIFFAFMGANLVGLTYAIDSFPQVAAPLLVLICAGRGFISFGLSYATLPATQTLGYDGTMNVFAIITGVLCLLGFPMYFWGRQIRRMGQRWFALRE